MTTDVVGRSGRGPRGLAGVLLAGIVIVGCRDAASDPVAVLVARETRPALALRAELPALPDLAERGGVRGRLAGAVELWESSWDGAPGEGLELRSEAYRRAAPELAAALGPGVARRTLDDVGLALAAVSTLEEETLEPALAVEVNRARTLHRRAEGLLAAGEVPEAFRLEMEASDSLRAVAPPVVANSLRVRAREAFEARLEGTLTEEDRGRVERLLEGADRAADAGDWSRAIRRAFYASQLLGLDAR